MRFRQVFFSVILIGFILYMGYKYFQSIPYTGDTFMSVFFALIILGFLVFILARILNN